MYISNQPDFMLKPETLDRRRCPDNEAYPVMLNYESRYMKWIHRSAFEFLSNLNKSRPFESSRSYEELLQQIAKGWINYAMAAPSYLQFQDMPLIADRLKLCVHFVGLWYDDYPVTASTLLDILYSVYAQVGDSDEFDGALMIDQLDLNTNICAGKTAFWTDCASSSRLHAYISSRMDCILKETACDSLIAHLLIRSLEGFSEVYWRSAVHNYFAQLTNCLSDALLQCTFQRLEDGRFAQATKYICISQERESPVHYIPLDSPFNCACWKEPATGGSMAVMARLLRILRYLMISGIVSEPTQLPTSLSTFMDVTDLYVAPTILLNRLHIQMSARAWTTLCRDRGQQPGDEGDIGSHVSAVQVDRAVRVLCVPSLKRTGMAPSKEKPVDYNRYRTLPWDQATELQTSEFIVLQPSTATSDQLLSLLGYRDHGNGIEFGVIPNK
ncbi:hypothetical protein F4823DRAFT_383719 [Ustulina deusta]|nr:hypothetical protein F4823DRAFT_383719 [Ustulina deusta]